MLEITNGPSLHGPILGLFVVLIFLVSNQTRSPFLNGVKVFFHLSAILLMASSCAANVSSLSQMRVCILSSIIRYLVFLNVTGSVLGDSPCMSSKGECFHSACHLLLCVNSTKNNFLAILLETMSRRLKDRLLFLDLLIQ